jgi:hypothetical protein
VVIAALISAAVAIAAALLLHETHRGRLVTDWVAQRAWGRCRRAAAVLKPLAVTTLVYVEILRRGTRR